MAKIDIEFIESRRRMLGITQTALAEKMGITRSMYSRLKHGKRKFSLGNIESIWRVLDLPLSKIIILESSGIKSKNV